MPFLYHITANGSALERWKLDASAVIVGRGGEAARVVDECLSREHFLVWPRGGDFIIRDLDSKNGTWVNGCNVRCKTLPLGARIEAGRSTFLFEPGLQTALDDLPAAHSFFRHRVGAEIADAGERSRP